MKLRTSLLVLLVTAISGCTGQGPFTQSTTMQNVMISEIYYTAANGLDDFIEIYVYGLDGTDRLSLDGWRLTTFDDDDDTLPEIENVGNFDYVVIRMGSGLNDLDASDGNATIYLNKTMSLLDDSGDEVGLYDSAGKLIDFVRYDGGNGDPVEVNWDSSDPGISTRSLDESIQIIGFDIDNSGNWISSAVSGGEPNVYDFMADEYDLRVRIHNGVRYPYAVEDGKFPIGNVSITVSPGNPVDNGSVGKFREYIIFSLDLYNRTGFNDPETGPDGILDVTLLNASSAGKTPSTGKTNVNDGSITIWVGFNNLTDKWTIEHELMHAIQSKKTNDSSNATFTRLELPIYKFKTEGFSEYWGMKSTMLNFNKTEKEVLDEASRLMGYGLDNLLNDTDFNVFSQWPGGWKSYVASYLFIKFIAQRYNETKLMDIYYSQANYGDRDKLDSNDTLGHAAIEKAFNKQTEHRGTSFNDTFIGWTIWLWETYRDQIVFASSETFNGSGTLTETGMLEPWGTDYERVKVNTSGKLKIKFRGDDGKTYSITLIKIKSDGTEERESKKVYGAADLVVEEGYKEIIIIKSHIDSDAASSYTIAVSRSNNSIENTTIDDSSNVEDSVINDSIISGSDIDNSTLINCTVINSTITGSRKVNCIIINSFNSGSNVTNSTEDSSNIVASDVSGSTINKSMIITTVVMNSTVSNSATSSSGIQNEKITGRVLGGYFTPSKTNATETHEETNETDETEAVCGDGILSPYELCDGEQFSEQCWASHMTYLEMNPNLVLQCYNNCRGCQSVPPS